jgi:dUTPase
MRGQEAMIIRPFDYVKIPLGVRGFCPPGWWYELKPRSSTFAKKNLHALYGTIDETYEGELVFACQYLPPVVYTEEGEEGDTWYEPENWADYCACTELRIEFGDAVGQLIPIRRDEMIVEEITNEDYDNACKARASIRGAGGFGSTGK